MRGTGRGIASARRDVAEPPQQLIGPCFSRATSRNQQSNGLELCSHPFVAPPGSVCTGKKMRRYRSPDQPEPSRAGEYRSHAERLREMARQTRFPDVRIRLLSLAASFDRLADRSERWAAISVKAAD